MSKEQKIVYENHPVSAERKAELRQQGYKIIDARFAPADQKHAKQEGGQDDKPMAIPEIKKALAEKGVAIPDGVTKRDDLKALLDAAGEGQGGQGE